MLQLGGVTVGTALIAGCADEGPGEEEEEDPDEEENGVGDEPEDEEDEADEEDPDDEEDEEDPDEEDPDEEEPDDEGEEDEEDEEADENGDAIEPGTTIMFDGQTAGWVGLEPSEIEDEENPTLVLEAGEDYEMGWEEGDGSSHNIGIRDGDGEIVDDYETDLTSDPDEDQILEFTADEEMAEYVCAPHETTMIGEMDVQ